MAKKLPPVKQIIETARKRGDGDAPPFGKAAPTIPKRPPTLKSKPEG